MNLDKQRVIELAKKIINKRDEIITQALSDREHDSYIIGVLDGASIALDMFIFEMGIKVGDIYED